MEKLENIKLENDVLVELEKINKYSFTAINSIKTNNLNTIDKIVKIISYCQYIEREAIRIRLLINHFSCSIDNNTSVNFLNNTDNPANNENETITISSVIDWKKGI